MLLKQVSTCSMSADATFTSGLQAIGNTAQLATILFFEYLSGPSFECDTTQTLLMAGSAFTLHGRRLSSALRVLSQIIAQKMLYRLVESCVLATVVQSHVVFFQNAAAHHLLLPFAQEYFFARSWITRFFYAGGRLLLPRAIFAYCFKSKSLQLQNPVDPLNGLPDITRNALRFFHHSYRLSIPYAIVTSGFVGDATHVLLQQMMWFTSFRASRGMPTSRWRLLKPYICNIARGTIETSILYTARVAGAFLGLAVSGDAVPSSGIFWGERLAVLAAIPFARLAASGVSAALERRLEAAHPATPEDEREDKRQQDAREEAVREEDTGAVDHWEVPRGDLYAILGLGERASAAEIRRAYRKAALESHPDRVALNGGSQEEARERMVLLNRAYETLNSETRRRQYDASRKDPVLVNSLHALDRLSPASAVALGVLGIIGLSLTGVTLLFSHYRTGFYQMTAPGIGPLRFFSGM